MVITLPEVDKTKLLESYKLRNSASELRKAADILEELSRKLHKEHYLEQYDRCRSCNGRGIRGEGLLSQVCGNCNSGLVPKGFYDRL